MATKIVSVDDMQEKIQELLLLISKGDNIIIQKNNKPFARITAISQSSKKRIPGLNRGEIWTSNDFDDPLPDDYWLGEK